MSELWAVYDRFKQKTGRIIERNSDDRLKPGEFHLVATGVIVNSKNQILVSRRNPKKKLYPNLWECNGGSVILGENSLLAAIREINEEIGVILKATEGKFLGTVQQNDYFRDVWKFVKDLELNSLRFNDGEVVEVRWVTEEEYKKMLLDKRIVPTGDCIIDLLEKEREWNR